MMKFCETGMLTIAIEVATRVPACCLDLISNSSLCTNVHVPQVVREAPSYAEPVVFNIMFLTCTRHEVHLKCCAVG
jgi:hypothetical protein